MEMGTEGGQGGLTGAENARVFSGSGWRVLSLQVLVQPTLLTVRTNSQFTRVIKKLRPSPNENVFAHDHHRKSHLLMFVLRTKHITVFRDLPGKVTSVSLLFIFSSVSFAILGRGKKKKTTQHKLLKYSKMFSS